MTPAKSTEERLAWVDDRLESIEGTLAAMDTTLNNHMNDYVAKLAEVMSEVRLAKEVGIVRADALGWQFKVVTGLLFLVIGALITWALVTGVPSVS